MTRAGRQPEAYSRITVTLPAFVIAALREMVKGSTYTVSDLLAGWLLRSLSRKDLLNVADRHPEFRAVIEAWLERRSG